MRQDDEHAIEYSEVVKLVTDDEEPRGLEETSGFSLVQPDHIDDYPPKGGKIALDLDAG